MRLAQHQLTVCLRQESLSQPIILQGKGCLAGCEGAQGSLSLSWWKSPAYWEDKLGAPLRDFPGWEKSYQSRVVIFGREKFEWILSNLWQVMSNVMCTRAIFFGQFYAVSLEKYIDVVFKKELQLLMSVEHTQRQCQKKGKEALKRQRKYGSHGGCNCFLNGSSGKSSSSSGRGYKLFCKSCLLPWSLYMCLSPAYGW